MYNLKFTSKIQRNIKLMKKRGKDLDKLTFILKLLQQGQELPANIKTTPLAEITQDAENVILNLTGFWFMKF